MECPILEGWLTQRETRATPRLSVFLTGSLHMATIKMTFWVLPAVHGRGLRVWITELHGVQSK